MEIFQGKADQEYALGKKTKVLSFSEEILEENAEANREEMENIKEKVEDKKKDEAEEDAELLRIAKKRLARERGKSIKVPFEDLMKI